MCTSLPRQPALSTPQHLFPFCSLILPLSSSLLTNQSPYILFPPWLFAFPRFTSVSLHSLSLWVPNTAVVGADVWCGACGGGGSARIKPQSRNRSEAAQLYLTSDLAAWDKSHELPAHGKPSFVVMLGETVWFIVDAFCGTNYEISSVIYFICLWSDIWKGKVHKTEIKTGI